MTLLAHLVPQIAASEPATTLALAYLLRSNDLVAQAFVALLGPTGLPAFSPVDIQTEKRAGDGRPDLTVRDPENRIRILVENKFWADLTDAQPLNYLDALPEDPPGAVLFIVPKRRMPRLWDELQRRCQDRYPLCGGDATETLTWGRAGTRTLAVTNWRHVLDTLSEAAPDCGIWRCDMDQVRGLVKVQEDVEPFLPLRDEEVRAAEVAGRILDYIQLSPDIVDALVRKGLAAGVTAVRAGGTWVGQYLVLQGRFRLWMGVHYTGWKRWGLTPIWAELDSTDSASGIQNRLGEAMRVLQEAKAGDGRLLLPIGLTSGVERTRVIEDAVAQLRDVATRLHEAFPPPEEP